uniref:Uncharacterized protein n=1 Tax=Arundo donax TaxID=35708 RepID=A0A0A9B5Y9_ARUDO
MNLYSFVQLDLFILLIIVLNIFSLELLNWILHQLRGLYYATHLGCEQKGNLSYTSF